MGDAVVQQHISPHKVTKPIQLLAAWMVGLILTNASFLGAAVVLESAHWGRGALVGASIANVPLFLLALFVLQTKFRAELQEDTFYSDYLSKKSPAVIRLDKNAAQDAKIDALEKQVASLTHRSQQPGTLLLPEEGSALDWSAWAVALNAQHPQFREIREALKSAQIPLAEVFASNSTFTPKVWIISMDLGLPFSHRVKLLKTLVAFHFDGFQFWQPNAEADENENVYIGSYGGGTWIAITEKLSQLLAGSIEPIDLKMYAREYKRTDG